LDFRDFCLDFPRVLRFWVDNPNTTFFNLVFVQKQKQTSNKNFFFCLEFWDFCFDFQFAPYYNIPLNPGYKSMG
jgi:hypothetical protein